MMARTADVPVVIVGAGRQGRNALDILRLQHDVAGFVDDTMAPGTVVDGAPVLGPLAWIDDPARAAEHAWIVAIRDNFHRKSMTERVLSSGGALASAVHPDASIAASARIGPGSYVNALCRIHPGARLGRGVLIESLTMIGCDTVVGPYARTGPGCALPGGSALGELSFMGAGAVLGENIAAGARCVIGANSVVLASTGDDVRLYGAPAAPRDAAP